MMTRSVGLIFLVTVALAQNGAPPQPERSPFEAAYRNWRAADPDLERDTAAANPAMGARADKVAAEAAKYFAARKTYWEKLQTDVEGAAAAMEPFPALLEIDSKPATYVANQTRLLNGSIDSIAADPDRAIQRLRAALDRERSALTALASALTDTERGYDQAQTAAMAAEQARGKAARDDQSLSTSLKQTAAEGEQTANLWAEYYRALSDGVRGVVAKNATPEIVPAPAPAADGNTAAPASSLPPNPPADAGPNAPPALRTRPITPLPLSRYLGAWVYPTLAAEFHGTEPSTVDMLIRESNGQAKGTLIVWFKVAPTSKTEPAVRFDFAGPFQNSRNQSFPLITSNGAAGTVELVPGNVYNMIQVRFTTGDKPETIRQADFLLIKK